MSFRRSRFHRMYRRLVRGQPDRRRQWQEISQLRPQGSGGCKITRNAWVEVPNRSALASSQPFAVPPMERAIVQAPGSHLADSAQSDETQSGHLGVTILTIWLFLTACAYGGYAGLMHARNDATAWVGLAGSVVCLIVAALGICLTTSPRPGRQSVQLLGLLALFLTGVYMILALLATRY